VFALICAGLVFLSCDERPNPPTPEKNLVSVKFGLRPHLSFAPLKIAKVEGYFAEEGLDVEILDIFPADGLVALPLGHLDAIGVPVFTGLFNAMEREPFVRIVADKGHIGKGCSPYMIMARSDLLDEGDLAIDEIRGLKLERREGSIYDFIMEHFFEAHGLGWEDFEPIEWIPPHMSAAGFEADQLDLKIETEPNISALSDAELARPWFSVAEVTPGLQFSAIVYGPRLIEKEPEIGIKFMKGYLRGVRQYNGGATDRNVDIVSDFTGLDPDLVRKACWTPIDPNGMIDTDKLGKFIDWLKKDGFVDSDLRIEDWWDPRFAIEASRALAVDTE